MLDFKKLWQEGLTFDAFVDSCKAEHCGLWRGLYNLARVPAWAREAVPPGNERKLLVIAEDWCGDASNTVPIIAKLVEVGGTFGQSWHLLTAAAFVSMVVPLIVFFALQRYFVRGLLAGAVKG